jgi:CheY-like chemotaxis protein
VATGAGGGRYDLVEVADLVTALICFAATNSTLSNENASHHGHHAIGLLVLVAFADSAPLALLEERQRIARELHDVVVADDQGMVRSGFSILLNAQPDIEVVGEAVNGQQAIVRAAELRPDVILMDVRMPVLDGLQATRQIAAGDDTPRVLILTTFDLHD